MIKHEINTKWTILDLKFLRDTLIYIVGSYEDPWAKFSRKFEDIINFMSVYR